MKPALSRRPLRVPLHWHELPMGAWLEAEVQERLNAWCPMLFGYHLLKLGALSSELSCQCSTIRQQSALAPEGEHLAILGELEQLPVRDGSVDACLLAHALDYSADPHQVLREVDRVLTADGWVLISGFNPHSLLGLGALWPRLRQHHPWHARLFAPERIRDWLELLGFELVYVEQFGFSSFSSHSRIHWWRENIGRLYFGYFASVYVLAARKRTVPLTPERDHRWLRKPVILPGMAGVGG